MTTTQHEADNKDVVRRYWDQVWNEKQAGAVEQFVAPVHTIHLAGGQAHRPASIQAWAAQALTSFPDVHFTIDWMVAEDDVVASKWSYVATHTGPFLGIAPTGRQVTDSGTTTVRLEDGKIAEMWVNQDSLGLLQQLGAVRSPGAGGWGEPEQPSAAAGEAGLTPSQNNDIAKRFFHAAWDEGDFAVLDELLTSDSMDYSTLHGEPEQGSEGFRQIIGMFRASFPDIALTIDDEIFTGDRVVHRWTLRGTHTGAPFMGLPPAGTGIEFTGTTTVQMRDGKIAARWSNLDLLRLMQELGMVPPPPG